MGLFKGALLGAACAASFGLATAHAATITSPSGLIPYYLGTGDGNGYQSTTTTSTTSAPFLGIASITYVGMTTGVYSGTSTSSNGSNGYTSPFGTASNRDFFAVQPGGSITFTYASAQTFFGVLIGTIDSYNSIVFTGASGTQQFSGTNITDALGGSANGSMTENVLFSNLNAFTSVTLGDSQSSAFEFDPASFAVGVPEPASLALLGLGVAGLMVARRRRKHQVGTAEEVSLTGGSMDATLAA